MRELRPWTREEDEIARRMDDEGISRRVIGARLNCTNNAVSSRLYFLATLDRDWVPTPEMIADRNARALLPHRDLTGAFFGDPPVGLSALEGRK